MFKSEDRAIIKKIAAQSKDSVKENKGAFWQLFMPLVGIIILLMFFDAYMSNWYISRFSPKFTLGAAMANIFLGFFYLRLFNFFIYSNVPLKEFKRWLPTKMEWKVFWVVAGSSAIFLAIFGSLGVMLIGNFADYIGRKYTPIATFLFIAFLVLYVSVRLAFYIVARFSNHGLTLWQAFRATNGFVIRILLAYFLSVWKLIFALFLLLFLLVLASPMLIKFGLSYQFLALVTHFFIDVPIMIYFYPLFMAHYVVVVLSFYRHFMDERATNEAELIN